MSEEIEDAKNSIRSGHDAMSLLLVFVGAYAHLFGLVLLFSSIAAGGSNMTDGWAILTGYSYLLMAVGLAWAGSGRRAGETGVRYIARIAISPYSKAAKLFIAGARAAPGFIREVYAWLVKPKEADEGEK